MEHSVQALQESSVTIKTPFVPSKLLGDRKTLDKLEITKVKSDETETIDLDHLFVNYGFKSSVGNLKNWGLDLNRHKIIVNSKQESSQAGIYAIGDCCYYEGKIDLIATGLGEAPTAVNNAINYIDLTKSTTQTLNQFIKRTNESYDSWFYSSSAITGVLLCTI